MEGNFDINNLVVIKQLPEIYEQLDKVNEFVLDKTKDIDEKLNEISMLSEKEQEEKKSEIKKYRTFLNSLKDNLETKRKEVKSAINKPYEVFEKVYKEKTVTILNEGISKLSSTITEIENRQLEEKRNELIEFLDEYIEFYNIGCIIDNIDQVPIKINLSNSLKSLKEEIIKFCEKVSDDLLCIEDEEESIKNEILYQYKQNGFDYANAVQTIKVRKKQQEELQRQMEKIQEQKEIEQDVIDVVNEVSTPKEIVEEEKVELTFTVRSTKSKLIELREFMKEKGIEYR